MSTGAEATRERAHLRLVIEDDEGRRTIVPVVCAEISIGRKVGNAIRLTERNISRFHARLLHHNTSTYIEDLNSFTGIRVNGDRISGRAEVREGDLIEIGDYHLALESDGSGNGLAPQSEEISHTEVTVRTPLPEELAEPTQRVELPPEMTAEMAPPPASTPRRDEPTAIVRADTIVPEPKTPSANADLIPERERARLVVVSTRMVGSEYALTRRVMVLGRTEDNDLILDHRSVSRHHAKIIYDGGHFTVTDLESANGVLVNGEEYKKSALRPGDIIELGHVRLRFIEPGGRFELSADEIAAIKAEAHELDQGEPPPHTLISIGGMAGIARALSENLKTVVVTAAIAFVLTGAAVTLWWQARDRGPEGSTPNRVVETPARPEAPARDLSALVQRAEGELSSGQLEQAAATVKEILSAQADHPRALALSRKLEDEQEAQATMAEAETFVEATKFERAIMRYETVPEGTLPYAKAREAITTLRAKIADGQLVAAREAMGAGRFVEARKMVERGLDFASDATPFKELEQQILQAEQDEANRQLRNRRKGRDVRPQRPQRPKPPPPPKVDPELAKGHFMAGNREFINGRNRQAIEQYQAALQADPSFADAYRSIGFAHQKLGENAKAAAAFERYLKARPVAGDAVRIRAILEEITQQNAP